MRYQYLCGYYDNFRQNGDWKKWTQKAADAGYALAQIDMARYYYSQGINEDGIKSDDINASKEGLYWLKKAAAQGDYFAIDMLASGSTISFFAG